MSRPLSRPEEGFRLRLVSYVTSEIRAHLEVIRAREGLASLSDAVDWLIRQDRLSSS